VTKTDRDAFHPFPTNHILPETKGKFSIYLIQNAEFVLYTRLGVNFTVEHREQLESQGIRQVYLPLAQKNAYQEYLREHLGRILGDESMPIEERVKTWSDTTREMARGIFERNLPQGSLRVRYRRMENVMAQSTSMFKNPLALNSLSKFVLRDNEDYSHGIGTMVYTGCLLETFEPDDALLTASCMGALLHDIGKTRLPREIFDVDPQQLKGAQRDKYQSHPVIGVQMSAGIPLGPEAIHCVLFHHECQNGKGFPTGAMGNDIPLHAKVTALANRYDNLIRGAAYRPAMQPFNALKIISNDKGAYDSDLLKRLIQILADANITN